MGVDVDSEAVEDVTDEDIGEQEICEEDTEEDTGEDVNTDEECLDDD